MHTKNIFSEKELLIKLIEDGILDTAELAKNMNLENEVKKVHPYPLPKEKNKRGLYVATVRVPKTVKPSGRLQISAKDIPLLCEKLLAHYALPQVYSLEELFPLWLPYHMDEIGNNKETKRRTFYFWKKYYLPYEDFINKPITEITAHDIKVFLSSFGTTISRTTLGNIKSILNGIYAYAVDKGIVDINRAKQVVTTNIKCKSETKVGQVAYTDEDRCKIVSYLKDSTDPYDEIIILYFYVCDRIGAFRALKWEDVDFKNRLLYMRSQIVRGEDSYITEKECTKTGVVGVHELSPEAINFLKKWRKERPFDTGYIFKSRTGRATREDTIRDHMKRVCKATGVTYRKGHGTHAARAWSATKTAREGGNVIDILNQGNWQNMGTAYRYLQAAQSMDRKLVNRVFELNGHTEVTQT